ncbi:hypothetical protein [Pseudomonas batumici]
MALTGDVRGAQLEQALREYRVYTSAVHDERYAVGPGFR